MDVVRRLAIPAAVCVRQGGAGSASERTRPPFGCRQAARSRRTGRRRSPSGGLCLLGSAPIAPYYRYSTNPAGRLFAVRKRPALLSAGRYWRWGSSCRRPAFVRLGRRHFILFIRYKRCFIIVYNPKRGQGFPPPLWGAASGGRADGSGVPMRCVLKKPFMLYGSVGFPNKAFPPPDLCSPKRGAACPTGALHNRRGAGLRDRVRAAV